MNKIDEEAFQIYTKEEDIEDLARIKQHIMQEITDEFPRHKQEIKYYVLVVVEFHKTFDEMMTDPQSFHYYGPTFRVLKIK